MRCADAVRAQDVAVAAADAALAWEIADRKDRLVKDVKQPKPKKGE